MALAAGLAAGLPLASGRSAAQDQAAPPPLNLEQRMLLRCAAAFALGARAQEDGVARARAWPPLAERGREFFVLASAQVMDQAGLDRAAVSSRLFAEAQQIVNTNTLAQIMPVCLPMLDAIAPQAAPPGA